MTIDVKALTDDRGLMHRDTSEFVVRAEAVDTDERTVVGIGVPYGDLLETPWFREVFAPGSVDGTDALAYYRHSDPIGRVIACRDTDAGHEVTLRISQTPLGDEALTLARDGVIRSLSIGFEPVEWTETHDEGEDDPPLITHTKVRAREFSLVPFPAYETASISSVRHDSITRKDPAMTETAPVQLPSDIVREADLTQFGESIRTEMRDAVRSAALGSASLGSAADDKLSAATEFRGLGDFVKSLVSEDGERADLARTLYRDVVTSDLPTLTTAPGFLGDLTKKMQARRAWINRFTTKPLPAKGMTVDYVRRTRGATVGEQPRELDPLPKGTTRGVEAASAPVRTFGGAETVSRQVIDRISEDEVAAIFEAMAYEYAEVTDNAMAAHVVGELEARLSENRDVLTMPNEPTAFDWINAVVDAAERYDATAYGYTELAVSGSLFKRMAGEAGLDGRPLLSVHQGTGSTNVVGSLNLPRLEGNILNVPVRLLPRLRGVADTPQMAAFIDPVACEFRESPGAPFRLQQDQILNLSRDLAVYGYAAFLTPHPDALLPIDFTDAG